MVVANGANLVTVVNSETALRLKKKMLGFRGKHAIPIDDASEISNYSGSFVFANGVRLEEYWTEDDLGNKNNYEFFPAPTNPGERHYATFRHGDMSFTADVTNVTQDIPGRKFAYILGYVTGGRVIAHKVGPAF